jgi:hypothetical protein
LTYYKPVIVLGHAFYEGRGISYTVNDEQEMYNAICKAEEGQVSKGIIDKFLHYLFKRQWHVKQLEDVEKVMSLIYRITE